MVSQGSESCRHASTREGSAAAASVRFGRPGGTARLDKVPQGLLEENGVVIPHVALWGQKVSIAVLPHGRKRDALASLVVTCKGRSVHVVLRHGITEENM